MWKIEIKVILGVVEIIRHDEDKKKMIVWFLACVGTHCACQKV